MFIGYGNSEAYGLFGEGLVWVIFISDTRLPGVKISTSPAATSHMLLIHWMTWDLKNNFTGIKIKYYN